MAPVLLVQSTRSLLQTGEAAKNPNAIRGKSSLKQVSANIVHHTQGPTANTHAKLSHVGHGQSYSWMVLAPIVLRFQLYLLTGATAMKGHVGNDKGF